MRLATTTADFCGYCETTAEAVRAYEGTGFTHLDYSFYRANYPGSPFMGSERMKDVVASAPSLEVKRAAVRLMFEVGKDILTKYGLFEG